MSYSQIISVWNMLSRVNPAWKQRITVLVATLLAVLIIPTPVVGEEGTPTKESSPLKERPQLKITAVVKAARYTPPPPIPPPKPVVHTYVPIKLSAAAINFLGNCESGNNPTTNTGNGYYGAFQFSIGTWNAMVTGYARADLAPYNVQVQAVHKLLSTRSIYTQFPACAVKMRNAGLI